MYSKIRANVLAHIYMFILSPRVVELARLDHKR